MLNIKVIGCGAAGNKAAINLVTHGFTKENVVLANSTNKDIAAEYDIPTYIISDPNSVTLGGCGKERSIGKKLALQSMQSGNLPVDTFVDPTTNLVVIVTSTEGGTGSAISPILAKYIHEVMETPVIICGLFGFNTDVRGMQNSIEFCQELSDDIGFIGICNSKFMDANNGNKFKSELAANDEFCEIIQTLTGCRIIPSQQNIDDTDLLKLVTTPGYMKIEKCSINKVKNDDDYNKAMSLALDESHLMESPAGCKRLGVIFDINKNIEDNINFGTTVLENEYGTPYELFTHLQYEEANTVTWIAAGLPLPIDEVQEIYQKYLDNTVKVNKAADSFFDNVSQMFGKEEDGMFDMLATRQASAKKAENKANFFAEFGMSKKKKTTDPSEDY